MTEKVIVLTGAMVPYARSAAPTGRSISAARSRSCRFFQTGIYVAMNGRCFRWDDVRKNRETGTFEPLPRA